MHIRCHGVRREFIRQWHLYRGKPVEQYAGVGVFGRRAAQLVRSRELNLLRRQSRRYGLELYLWFRVHEDLGELLPTLSVLSFMLGVLVLFGLEAAEPLPEAVPLPVYLPLPSLVRAAFVLGR